MTLAFTPVPVTAVPVAGIDNLYFPIHRIYCFGACYPPPGQEVSKADRKPPFLSLKPSDGAVICPNKSSIEIPYPRDTSDVRLEVELVVAIGKTAPEKGEVSVEEAESYIFGYGVGLDIIKFDRAQEVMEKRFPWDISKTFDDSALISEIYEKGSAPVPDDVQLWLNIDNKECQRGSPKNLIWSVPEQISLLSKDYRLVAGDLIYTGAPNGMSPIGPGQSFEGGINGLCIFSGNMSNG